MATIITKFSSTPSSVPSNTDLVQGELAVNTADKRLYTEDNGNVIIELGTNPSSITTPSIILDGRDLATDRTKLDGIEPNATADQTDAEIKTAYENNADTNAFTDSEKTKLGTVESGADITDATNVDAAGAVMNTDTSTVAMGFVIDEDDMASNSDTKVPTQQSVEARIQNRITAIGALMVTGTPVLNDYARFTSATEIEGRSYAEVRVDLGLEIGTDVQAELSGLAITNVTASTGDKVLIQDVDDSNNLKTVLVSDILGNVITDPTLGTLTKTFVTNEQATITLSSAPTGQPVVSVSKEVPQTGTTNDYWDVNSTTENYTRTDYASGNLLFVPSISSIENRGSFNVGTEDGQPTSVWLNADGTKMFVTGAAAGEVNEYALSTAYITTSASFTRVYSTATQDTTPESLAFNTDGTKMFVLGAQNGAVYEYTLSTGFNLNSVSFVDSFSVSGQDSLPYGLTFNPDGTKMFVTGATNDSVYEYALSMGFDVSTATYTQSFDLSGETTNPRGVAFTNNGKVMFICSNNNDTIFQYALTTGYDVSTAAYSGISKSIAALDQQPEDIFIPSSEDYLIVVDEQNNDIRSYTIPLLAASSTSGAWAATDVGKTIEANGGVFLLTNVGGTILETVSASSYDEVASGSWDLYALIYDQDSFQLSAYIDPATAFDTASIVDPSLRYTVKLPDKITDLSSTRAIEFNDDGTKLFIISFDNDTVYQYLLSEPYDVGSAVFDWSYSLPTGVPEGITFSPDGTKMFIVDSNLDRVTRFDLGTAYNLRGTVTQNGFKSVATEETAPTGVAFSTDGTVMIVAADTGGGLDEYSLSTAWDVTTASFVDFTLLDTASPNDLAFSLDGTKLFVIQSNDQLEAYTLSTPFDANTITFKNEYLTSPFSEYEGLTVDRTGTRIFLLDNGGSIDELYSGNYNAVSGYHAAHTTTSTDSTYWTDINSMTVDEAAGVGNVYYAVSTDDRTTWSVIDNTNGVRDIVRNNLGTWQYNSNTTYASTTWTAGTTNTELATLEEAMSVIVVDPYTITDVAFVDSFSVTTEDVNPSSVVFNSNGTKMFVTGYTGQDVNEYSLSIAYDVSTASYTQNFSVASQETQPWAMNFNTDGTKMFVTGQASRNVHEYDLTTGFDVSTASFSQTFSLGINLNTPVSIEFNPSGTLMYVLVSGPDAVFRYTLSTGFDISTASASDQNFYVGAEEAQPYGFVFNDDGTKFYIAGNTGDDITEYSLSTAYDLTTASATGVTFSTASQTAQPVSMRWNGDGSKFFVLGQDNDVVYEYALNPGYSPNWMDKTQLEAVTDPNHYTLGNDLDLAIIFSQTAITT
jgi:sugar lactone lactonase YvrE